MAGVTIGMGEGDFGPALFEFARNFLGGRFGFGVQVEIRPDRSGIAGRKVRTVGLFLNQSGSSPKLVRLIMWCCAADSVPVSVELTGNTTGKWDQTQWLEVVGTATFPSTLGTVIPRIEVDTIKPTQEPDEPYLSP